MELRRARPWLGTLVEVRVAGVDESRALEAVNAAFAEIAAVHRLMSFHAYDSDLARLNRHAAVESIAVDARTHAVIAQALQFARDSDGRFDPSIAHELVARGILPRPPDAPQADPRANWRDVILGDDGCIRYARPLWLDLGGIAKGYAVDRAIDALRATGIRQACVNAGGDLRRMGCGVERIEVRCPEAPQFVFPAFELGEGSVASSGGYFERRRERGRWISPHIHGRSRRPLGTANAVSVVAEKCVVADGLTKIVLADPHAARPVLDAYAASACVHTLGEGWRVFGQTAA
ncbi:MAG: FAD:protein FMN transferase [Dokdonella sp.]